MNNKDTVYFAKVKSNAIIPSKSSDNAGYDIYICTDKDYIILQPHKTTMLPTGIASAFSDDYYFQIEERGSTGSKGIGKRAGVIDSSFRGEWFIAITNYNNYPVVIAKEGVTFTDIFGEVMPADTVIYPMEKAIAQAVLLPIPKVDIEEILYEDLLNIESKRGTGMLGSSGK